jgi:hypothetical protein
VTNPNPEHLLDRAERLIASARGAPRQVDLRRAISDAYYALFHAASAAVADEFVGTSKQSSPLYGLVYRRIEHRPLRQLCEDISRRMIPSKYLPYFPQRGPGGGVLEFAAAVADLQPKRHAADYDPALRVSVSDARLAIDTARRAVSEFHTQRRWRQEFLTLLLFPPR